MAPPAPHWRPAFPPGLAISTLNICNIRSFGIAQEVRAVKLGGFDLAFLSKIKISMVVYFLIWLGYNTVCLTVCPDSDGEAQVGVGLVLRYRPMKWSFELMFFRRLNVVSCKVVTGTS